MAAVERRSARAILIDDEGRLVLIKRSKPGRAPYWTTAGGGVEDSDASIEAAMHRELFEELGAQAIGASQVFLASFRSATGLHVQHFFVTRLAGMDLAVRTGPEFTDPARGSYDPDWVDLRGNELADVDLQPPELKAFILANREALLAEAASPHDSGLHGPDRRGAKHALAPVTGQTMSAPHYVPASWY